MVELGRTVPSFRIALEEEIRKWSEFRKGLRVEEQIILDELLNDVRKHADAGSLVCSPTISEIVLMSILIELKKQLRNHEAGNTNLNGVKP